MANQQRRSSRGGGCLNAFFTILSILVGILILIVVAGFILILAAPATIEPVTDAIGIALPGAAPEATAPLPTTAAIAVVPTPQPTTVQREVVPTFTRPPKTDDTITPTNTRRATEEATITSTFPPPTPTSTPSDTPTPTPTEGPSATITATRSQFPFTKSSVSPIYLQNFANNAGCNWLGIAGEVLDLNRNPVPSGSYRVHVWGSGIDERVTVGTAPDYSPSGWEQFVHNAPAVRDYNIQLESTEGTPVSQAYAVQTRASCNENLVYFIFEQNH